MPNEEVVLVMEWGERHTGRVIQDYACTAFVYKLAHEYKKAEKPGDSCFELYTKIAQGVAWVPEGEEWTERETAIGIVGWAVKSITWNQKVLFEMQPGPTQRRLSALHKKLCKAHDLMFKYFQIVGDQEYADGESTTSDAIFASSGLVQAVKEALDSETLKYKDEYYNRFINMVGESVVSRYETLIFSGVLGQGNPV